MEARGWVGALEIDKRIRGIGVTRVTRGKCSLSGNSDVACTDLGLGPGPRSLGQAVWPLCLDGCVSKSPLI